MHPMLRLLAIGAGVGLAYTLPMRLLFAWAGEAHNGATVGVAGVMTTAFLFGVPAATGALSVGWDGQAGPVPLRRALLLPWVACATAVLVAMLTLIEGSICLAMAAPVFLLMGSLGGWAMWWTQRRRANRGGAGVASLSIAALLPLVWGGAEAQLTAPADTWQVTNVQVIAAPVAVVWEQVASVRKIEPSELPPSFAHWIGLPRPIEATLSAPAKGGVRMASFERGLVFREEVTDWQPGKTIAFGIRAEQAPAEALDEHVVVGGRYFDVLDGRYTLRAIDPQHTEVTLSSTHRLSTTLNGYAGLWTRAIMWDLQRVILHVVAKRSESRS
ncbi:MAG: hypothetical protein HY902_15525 [Deltaproteobacteria bacterium]|nr:hypothetical protein [Deltaproteobacteria bacterium]